MLHLFSKEGLDLGDFLGVGGGLETIRAGGSGVLVDAEEVERLMRVGEFSVS